MEILSNVCEILRIVDIVKSAVDALGEFWDSTTDVDKVNHWILDVILFRISNLIQILLS